jgi:hypothetical protein
MWFECDIREPACNTRRQSKSADKHCVIMAMNEWNVGSTSCYQERKWSCKVSVPLHGVLNPYTREQLVLHAALSFTLRRNIFVIALPNQITWFSNNKECCWSLGLRVQILSRLGCFCKHSLCCVVVGTPHTCLQREKENRICHTLIFRRCIKFWNCVRSYTIRQ